MREKRKLGPYVESTDLVQIEELDFYVKTANEKEDKKIYSFLCQKRFSEKWDIAAIRRKEKDGWMRLGSIEMTATKDTDKTLWGCGKRKGIRSEEDQR